MSAVEATINYLGAMSERPRYHAQDHTKDNLVLDPRGVHITDRRGDPASLAREGFELVSHKSAIADFRDGETVARVHNREIEELLLSVTGADRVVVTAEASCASANVRLIAGGCSTPIPPASSISTSATRPRVTSPTVRGRTA